MTAAEGQRALAQHAASMGRFGPGTGAFLTPLYGGSEMSQAFCRVAAVHGALYVLRQPIDALIMDPETAAQAGPSPNSPWNCRGVRLTTGQVGSDDVDCAQGAMCKGLSHKPTLKR